MDAWVGVTMMLGSEPVEPGTMGEGRTPVGIITRLWNEGISLCRRPGDVVG